MALVERCHAGVGVSALGDPEVEGAFGFEEIFFREFKFVGFRVGEFGEEAFGFREPVVGVYGLFDV